jgi:hypothetical protein
MYSKKILQQGITQLIQEGSELIDLVAKKDGYFVTFATKYQIWYTKCLRIIEFLAKDRLNEFKSYYEIEPKRARLNMNTYVIQDFCMGLVPLPKYNSDKPAFDQYYIAFAKLHNQTGILKSLESRIDSVYSDVQGIMLSEILDKELKESEKLLKMNTRSAGSLAGVVLESHLQKVAQNHSLTLRKKEPTISDLNEVLKTNQIYRG